MQNQYGEFLTNILVTALEAKKFESDVEKYETMESILSLVFRCEFYLRLMQEEDYSLVLITEDKDNLRKWFNHTIDKLKPKLLTMLGNAEESVKKNLVESARKTIAKELPPLKELDRKRFPYHNRQLIEYSEFILESISPKIVNLTQSEL